MRKTELSSFLVYFVCVKIITVKLWGPPPELRGPGAGAPPAPGLIRHWVAIMLRFRWHYYQLTDYKTRCITITILISHSCEFSDLIFIKITLTWVHTPQSLRRTKSTPQAGHIITEQRRAEFSNEALLSIYIIANTAVYINDWNSSFVSEAAGYLHARQPRRICPCKTAQK